MAEIQLKGISKLFDENKVIKSLDLSIANGEFITVVGPSGCGKSTLLRIIAGLESQSSGDVIIDGREVNKVRASERDLAMVFQSYALYPHLSVQQNIAMWELIYQVKSDIYEIAKILNIEQILNVDINSLSDGQKKRVSLARLIISNAKVWLLDEPLVYLDQDKIDLLQNIILRHNKRGGITIYSSNTNINLEYDSSIIMDDYVVL